MKTHVGQISLLEADEDGPETDGQLTKIILPTVSHEPRQLSHREAMLLQIIRDTAVLKEDPIWHTPSTEFFVERIAAYRQVLLSENQ